MRSTLAGGFWAAVLGSVGLGLASQLNDLPLPTDPPTAPEMTTPDVATAPEATDVASGPDPTSDVPVEPQDAPSIELIEVEEVAPEADTAIVVQPEETQSAEAPAVPETETVAPEAPEAAVVDATPDELAPAPLAEPEPEVEVISETAPVETADAEVEVAQTDTDVQTIEAEEQLAEAEVVEEAEAATADVVADGASIEIEPEAAPEVDTAVVEADQSEPVAAEPQVEPETQEVVTAEPDQTEVPRQASSENVNTVVEDVAEEVVAETESIVEEAEVVMDQSSDSVADVVEAEVAEPVETAEAEVTTEVETQSEVTTEEAPAPELEIAQAAVEPEPEPAPLIIIEPEPEVVEEPQPAPVVVVEPAPETAEPEAPVVIEVTPTPEPTVVTNPGVTVITGNSSGVRIIRPGQDTSDTPGQVSIEVEGAEVDPDAPALVRYASAFENPEGLPVMSILLIDDGSLTDAVQKVAGLPFATTVILNPLDPSASRRMADYRAQGIEVGLQTLLPEGATPIDVEVAFEAAFQTLPEAVVLYSDGTGMVQSSRSVTEQVMQVLAAEGRGFVMQQRGLGNAQRLATQLDVPSVAVLRDLDTDGQDAAAIGRALDQAALRVRQTGGAVLVARVAEGSLAALRSWSADAPSDQLILGPVTAILAPNQD